MSDTDPYADPAAPNVYYPEADVLKASEEAAAEVAAEQTVEEDPAKPEVEDAVPEGTVTEVVEWVGDDAARAARALDAEEAGQKRKSLIKTLKAIV